MPNLLFFNLFVFCILLFLLFSLIEKNPINWIKIHNIEDCRLFIR